MTRQEALNTIWKRLLIVLSTSLLFSVIIFLAAPPGGIAALVFLIGTIGSYVSVHRGLTELKDEEVVELSSTWLAIIVPSFVGGVLALVLYGLFLSNILSGDLFPKWEVTIKTEQQGLNVFMSHYADGMASYAKLFFWSFVAGFNQKYVVDIINSVKGKP
jgi:hypothetical protein